MYYPSWFVPYLCVFKQSEWLWSDIPPAIAKVPFFQIPLLSIGCWGPVPIAVSILAIFLTPILSLQVSPLMITQIIPPLLIHVSVPIMSVVISLMRRWHPTVLRGWIILTWNLVIMLHCWWGMVNRNNPCHSCCPNHIEPLCDCHGCGCCLSAGLCGNHCCPCPTKGLCNGHDCHPDRGEGLYGSQGYHSYCAGSLHHSHCCGLGFSPWCNMEGWVFCGPILWH